MLEHDLTLERQPKAMSHTDHMKVHFSKRVARLLCAEESGWVANTSVPAGPTIANHTRPAKQIRRRRSKCELQKSTGLLKHMSAKTAKKTVTKSKRSLGKRSVATTTNVQNLPVPPNDLMLLKKPQKASARRVVSDKTERVIAFTPLIFQINENQKKIALYF